ncbi:MAG: hypothetical protein GKR89_04265 [Candidatus Latescibacteria bacterium]|nr:hypothetical protein [Candidatus Latescibacterota bacterium]
MACLAAPLPAFASGGWAPVPLLERILDAELVVVGKLVRLDRLHTQIRRPRTQDPIYNPDLVSMWLRESKLDTTTPWLARTLTTLSGWLPSFSLLEQTAQSLSGKEHQYFYLDAGLLQVTEILKLGPRRPDDGYNKATLKWFPISFHSYEHPQPGGGQIRATHHFTLNEEDEGIWLLTWAPLAERYTLARPDNLVHPDSLQAVNRAIDQVVCLLEEATNDY